MAGYVLSNETGARLALTLEGVDPDRVTPPPPGYHVSGNLTLIEDEIKKYMAIKMPNVTATFTGTANNLETILVTQCFLVSKPLELNGHLPVAAEGRLEGLVRQWLESDGSLLSL